MGQLQHNLGNVLSALGRFDQALEPMQKAVALCPEEPECIVGLGNVLRGMNRYGSARDVLKAGWERFPRHIPLLNNYAHALHAMGRVEEAVPVLRQVAEAEPKNLRWTEGLAAVLNYAPGVSATELFEAHQRYGRLAEELFGKPAAWDRSQARSGQALRVGLISPDLRQHAVAYLIEAFLEYADPSRVQIACYCAAAREDAVSARLKGRTWLWRSVTAQSHTATADAIRRDKIDAVVDLAGHTNGHRLAVMALKPAPVQMTYMGYPNCTGLRSDGLPRGGQHQRAGWNRRVLR